MDTPRIKRVPVSDTRRCLKTTRNYIEI